QKGQQLDGGIQTGEESTGVEGDQARNGSVGAWSGVGIARSCGALTPVALRAPSVSAPQDFLTLLRRGTSYFALTGPKCGMSQQNENVLFQQSRNVLLNSGKLARCETRRC